MPQASTTKFTAALESALSEKQKRAIQFNRAALLLQSGKLDGCRQLTNALAASNPADEKTVLLQASLLAKENKVCWRSVRSLETVADRIWPLMSCRRVVPEQRAAAVREQLLAPAGYRQLNAAACQARGRAWAPTCVNAPAASGPAARSRRARCAAPRPASCAGLAAGAVLSVAIRRIKQGTKERKALVAIVMIQATSFPAYAI